jgi:hypothetical protein
MSFIFIVVLGTRKRLTPKDVAAVKGLSFYEHYSRLYKQSLCYEFESQRLVV